MAIGRVRLLALVCAACGGSTINGALDGGSDASDAQTLPEEGIDVGTDSPITKPYDGTTGKPCTTDADCLSPGGPGLARCSSTVFAPEDYLATAVCILPACSPISSEQSGLHFCDGPDDPSSPGICVASGTSGSTCLPKCNYDKTGDAPTGCQGHDVCFAYPVTQETGAGYCWGGCTQDADCQNGQKCQTDRGECVEGVTPPTKTFGEACVASDLNTGACNCLYGTSNTGYCSSMCIEGGPACPQGSVCDTLEARTYGYSTANTGMGGYCAIACGADAGVCPSTSTCTNVFATGPDCIPP